MQRTLTSLTENICESYIKNYFHINYIYGIRQLQIFFAINIILHWYLKRQLELDENLLKIFASLTLKIIFILAIDMELDKCKYSSLSILSYINIWKDNSN